MLEVVSQLFDAAIPLPSEAGNKAIVGLHNVFSQAPRGGARSLQFVFALFDSGSSSVMYPITGSSIAELQRLQQPYCHVALGSPGQLWKKSLGRSYGQCRILRESVLRGRMSSMSKRFDNSCDSSRIP